jgi:hypothetical protein
VPILIIQNILKIVQFKLQGLILKNSK